jgi:hypothetical protein
LAQTVDVRRRRDLRDQLAGVVNQAGRQADVD